MGDLRPAILATNLVLIALSLAAIACRVGRRIFLLRSSSWHDALIALATASATIFSILQIISMRFGEGVPNEEVPPSNMKIIYKLVMASRIFYFICNWAVKHSLLFFYDTLTIDKWPRRSIYAMHFVAFSFGMTCISVTVFQCIPISKIWNGPDDHHVQGHCVNMDYFNYFNSCFMLATDLILYAMPLVFTWQLNVSRTQRIAVNLLFALGGLVLAASGARVYFVHAQATHPDFTYRFAMTMLCAVIENHLAIIVACAPSIKVILLHTFPSLAIKFEKLVSKASPSSSEFRSSAIRTIAIDLEVGITGMRGQREITPGIRPLSMRTITDMSKRSREGKKWWKPPSSWEVNKAEREGCPLDNTPSILR